MGCLRAMVFRVIGSLVLLAVIVVGYVYRHEILDYWDQWRGGANGAAETWTAPAAGGAAASADKLSRLARSGGPAYVDLTAAEVGALIDAALTREARHVFDSTQVALLENEIRIRGSLDLSGVPRNMLGPLAGVVGAREPAAIGGPLSVDSTGQLMLTVTYLKVRDFPFPRSTIARILSAARVPGAVGASLPVPGTPHVGDVRITPSHVRVYRSSPR
jgi:hypothetical protein